METCLVESQITVPYTGTPNDTAIFDVATVVMMRTKVF
jgi:hypothetical protein